MHRAAGPPVTIRPHKMLASDDFEQFVRERGKWLFHASAAKVADRIVREGLRPGSEIGVSNKPGFHRTRPGHVYLCGREDAERTVDVDGPRAIFAVDLTRLELDRINPDEDMVFFSWLRFGEEWWLETPWVDAEPPWNPPPGQPLIEGPNGEGTLRYWAETTPGFDAPEVTRKSLWRGRVAHSGTIPVTALRRVT